MNEPLWKMTLEKGSAKADPVLQQKAPPERGWRSAVSALILVFQGVPNWDAKALYTRPAEFKIVANEIKVRFRPDENAAGHIKAKPAAHMSEEMVAALKVGATGKVAREEWLVKPKTLQAYTTLQLSLCSLT